MDSSTQARFARAQSSLEGLSVGDAFGQGFFMSLDTAERVMAAGEPPFDYRDQSFLRQLIETRRTDFIAMPWRWTDDTAMAIEIVRNLEVHGEIERRTLAIAFANRYLANPQRGYGGMMHSLLPNLINGDWETEATALFGGSGSFGNGAAMRAAPIGAYYADSLYLAAQQAFLSAHVTHSHLEGIAGAVAVAAAASLAASHNDDLIEETLPYIAECKVKEGLVRAQSILSVSVEEAAEILGNGSLVSAQDTVPFCLWCASRNLNDYSAAMWETVAGLGDRDTTCAIVGGIVAARTGVEGIPAEWRQNRESLRNI